MLMFHLCIHEKKKCCGEWTCGHQIVGMSHPIAHTMHYILRRFYWHGPGLFRVGFKKRKCWWNIILTLHCCILPSHQGVSLACHIHKPNQILPPVRWLQILQDTKMRTTTSTDDASSFEASSEHLSLSHPLSPSRVCRWKPTFFGLSSMAQFAPWPLSRCRGANRVRWFDILVANVGWARFNAATYQIYASIVQILLLW